MKGAVQVGGVLRKKSELRTAGEIASVHQVLQPLSFYQRLHPDPAACGPAQAYLCRYALLTELNQDDVRKRSHVHSEGESAPGFCLILSGALSEYKCQYASQPGAGRYLHKLEPGRGFGEEALTQITPRVHSSTLVVAESAELLVLRREDYAAMTAMALQAAHVSPSLRSEDDVLCLYSLASTLLFFRPVGPPALLQIARTIEFGPAAVGRVIASQGQPGDVLYVILSGAVRGSPQAIAGKRRTRSGEWRFWRKRKGVRTPDRPGATGGGCIWRRSTAANGRVRLKSPCPNVRSSKGAGGSNTP